MWKTLRDGFPAVFSSVWSFLYRFSRIFAVDSIYLIRTLIATLTKIRKVRLLTLALWVGFLGVRLSPVSAETADRAVRVPADTTEFSDSIPATRFLHRLEFDAQPLFVLPTNVFVKGYNEAQQAVRAAGAAHVDYGIQLHPATVSGRVYGAAYQGVGVGHYAFDNRRELGAAWAVYLYQGARLFAFTPRLSLDYRWNFGFSFGWHPFDVDSNPYNRSLGSPFNAYLDANHMPVDPIAIFSGYAERTYCITQEEGTYYLYRFNFYNRVDNGDLSADGSRSKLDLSGCTGIAEAKLFAANNYGHAFYYATDKGAYSFSPSSGGSTSSTLYECEPSETVTALYTWDSSGFPTAGSIVWIAVWNESTREGKLIEFEIDPNAGTPLWMYGGSFAPEHSNPHITTGWGKIVSITCTSTEG